MHEMSPPESIATAAASTAAGSTRAMWRRVAAICAVIAAGLCLGVTAQNAEASVTRTVRLTNVGYRDWDSPAFPRLPCAGASSPMTGAAVVQSACTAASTWTVHAAAMSIGSYGAPGDVIRDANTGLCLDTAAGSTRPGTPVVTAGCRGSATQRWLPEPAPAPYKGTVFRNGADPAECLGAPPIAGDDNTYAVVVAPCDPRIYLYQWSLDAVG